MLIIECLTWITNALLVVPPSDRRLHRGSWVIPLMPAYRYLVFWMRFAGTLTVLTDEHQWRTSDPVTPTREELRAMLRLIPGRDSEDRWKHAA